MKKILSAIIMLSFFLTGCLKDTTINSDGGLPSTPTAIQFTYSGLEYLGQASILTAGVTDPITNNMIVNVAGRSALSKDLTITVGVDDAKRVTYNTTSDIKFDAMPDSCYSIPVKTGTIKAGKYLDTLKVTFYPDKIDPSKNYMLPITLKDAQGQIIASNFSTYWYHTIGNPLAGNYNYDYSRWNTADGTGPLNGSSFTGHVATLLPVDPTTITVPSSYVSSYILSFDNSTGVPKNFTLTMDAKAFSDNGITLVDGPHLLIADPVAGHFKFQYSVLNSSGNPRYFIEDFYK